MLDKNDIVQLRGVFQEILKQNNTDLKVEIRDEMRALLAATEVKIYARMDGLDRKIDGVEKRIVTGIAEFLDGAILPQIAELQRDMTKVKIHLQLA